MLIQPNFWHCSTCVPGNRQPIAETSWPRTLPASRLAGGTIDQADSFGVVAPILPPATAFPAWRTAGMARHRLPGRCSDRGGIRSGAIALLTTFQAGIGLQAQRRTRRRFQKFDQGSDRSASHFSAERLALCPGQRIPSVLIPAAGVMKGFVGECLLNLSAKAFAPDMGGQRFDIECRFSASPSGLPEYIRSDRTDDHAQYYQSEVREGRARMTGARPDYCRSPAEASLIDLKPSFTSSRRA